MIDNEREREGGGGIKERQSQKSFALGHVRTQNDPICYSILWLCDPADLALQRLWYSSLELPLPRRVLHPMISNCLQKEALLLSVHI